MPSKNTSYVTTVKSVYFSTQNENTNSIALDVNLFCFVLICVNR